MIPEWLLALALTLFAIDVFFEDDALSWCGILTVAAYATWRIAAPWKWSILVFLGATLAVAVVYYWGFRFFVGKPVRRIFQGKAPNERLDSLAGAEGAIHIVEGKAMLRLGDDELWPIANPPPSPAEGMKVKVAAFRDGAAVLENNTIV